MGLANRPHHWAALVAGTVGEEEFVLGSQFWSIRKLMVVSRRLQAGEKDKVILQSRRGGADRQVLRIFLATGSHMDGDDIPRKAMRPAHETRRTRRGCGVKNLSRHNR